MAEAGAGGAETVETFGIEDLLDFSNEDIAGPIGDDMQSADSSVTAENFTAAAAHLNVSKHSGSSSSKIIAAAAAARPLSLIDRDFTVPAPVVDFEWLTGFESSYGSSSSSSKILLGGTAREEAEKENGGGRRLYMTSPVSVLESCATSAMISVGNAAGGTGGALLAAQAVRSKRGRHITPSSRVLLASCSATSSCEDDDEEDEEDDDDEDAEEEEDEDDEEEEEEEDEGSIESDCALSTESEVLTEEDFRPAKRQCHSKPQQQNQQQIQQQQLLQQRHHPMIPQQQIPPRQQQQQQGQPNQAAVVKNWQQQTAGIGDRRCSHCQTQKTPQWRAGPHGPKTLCNACGVRFKSGRLLPEYRPAGSPSYSSEQHSNSHRKVLEMRRQRETEVVRRMRLQPKVEIGGGGEIIQS